MLVETFMVLMLAAGVFMVAAALVPDQRLLLPAAAFLILSGGMLYASGTLEVHDGWEIDENVTVEEVDENLTEKDMERYEVKTYRDIGDDYGFPLVTSLAATAMIAGVGLMLIGVYFGPRGAKRRDAL